jgi:hypothetical protein
MKKLFVFLVICAVVSLGCNITSVLAPPTPVLTQTATPAPSQTPTASKTVTPTQTRTPRPTSTPDLGLRVDVKGGTMEITKTWFHEEQDFADKTYTPKEPFDVWVTAGFDTKGYPAENTPCDWKGEEQISLAYKHNGSPNLQDWNFCSVNSDRSRVELTFVAILDSQDWKINFPNGEVTSIEIPKNYGSSSTASNENGMDCQNDNGQKGYFKVNSPFTSQSILIDGQMSPDEWRDALCIDLQHYEWGNYENGEMHRARWWVQNDDQFIYYLTRVSKEIPVKGVAGAYFWPEYTGTWAHSDGYFVDTTGYFQDHSNWDESDWHKDDELSPPGTVDVEAAVNDDGDFYWFEIKKALDSGDGYDWSLEPGQIIGGNPHDSLLFVIVLQEGDYWRNIQMELVER